MEWNRTTKKEINFQISALRSRKCNSRENEKMTNNLELKNKFYFSEKKR